MLAALDALPALGMRGGDLTDWLRSPIDPAMVPSLRAAFDAVAQAPLDVARYPTLAKALWDALRSPLDAQLYRSVADLLFRPLQDDAIGALEQGVYRPFGRIFDSKGGSEPVIALAVSNATRMLVTATDNGVRRWQWTDKDTWEERPIIEPTVLTRPDIRRYRLRIGAAQGRSGAAFRPLSGHPRGRSQANPFGRSRFGRTCRAWHSAPTVAGWRR